VLSDFAFKLLELEASLQQSIKAVPWQRASFWRQSATASWRYVSNDKRATMESIERTEWDQRCAIETWKISCQKETESWSILVGQKWSREIYLCVAVLSLKMLSREIYLEVQSAHRGAYP